MQLNRQPHIIRVVAKAECLELGCAQLQESSCRTETLGTKRFVWPQQNIFRNEVWSCNKQTWQWRATTKWFDNLAQWLTSPPKLLLKRPIRTHRDGSSLPTNLSHQREHKHKEIVLQQLNLHEPVSMIFEAFQRPRKQIKRNQELETIFAVATQRYKVKDYLALTTHATTPVIVVLATEPGSSFIRHLFIQYKYPKLI